VHEAKGRAMQRLAGFMRTYWTRGEPGRETPRSLAAFMQRMWILALAFKLLGSSWDVSWHFKWLRDDFAPPHLLNTVGTGTAIGLVLAHSFTGYGAERVSLRIMQWGTGIFVIAGPIDVVNHRINGLDLTAWSPSHLLLYGGTAIMVIGVVRNWFRTYPRDGAFARQWSIGLIALFAFMFENLYFPTGQEEYGILEVASWLRGAPYAEPSLLSFAAGQLGRPVDDVALQHFAMPIPPWVYPMWIIGVCIPLLAVARIMVGRRWTATAVVVAYVAYRCVIGAVLTLGGFPPSYLPLWLLPLGVVVDLLFMLKLLPYQRAVLGGAVLTGLGYGALWISTVITGTPTHLADMTIAEIRGAFTNGSHLLTPPVAWSSIWLALPISVSAWVFATWLAEKAGGLTTPRPPRATVGVGPEPRRDAGGFLDGWRPTSGVSADEPPIPSVPAPRIAAPGSHSEFHSGAIHRATSRRREGLAPAKTGRSRR